MAYRKRKNKEVQGDCILRLKRIERELGHCDLDEQYRNDRCEFILGKNMLSSVTSLFLQIRNKLGIRHSWNISFFSNGEYDICIVSV